jgi:hypothetical protein
VAALSGKTCRSALRGPSGPTTRLSPPKASMTPPSAHCLPGPWIGPMLLEPCFLRSPKSRTSTDRDALRHSFDPCSEGLPASLTRAQNERRLSVNVPGQPGWPRCHRSPIPRKTADQNAQGSSRPTPSDS